MSSKRSIIVLLIVGFAALGVFAAFRLLRQTVPSHLVDIAGTPIDARWNAGAWYWLERPKGGKVRLVRATPSNAQTVASADEIVGYDVANGRVAWTMREGKQWTVMSGTESGKAAVWTGTEPAGRPCIADDRIMWTRTRRGLLTKSNAMPSLGPTLEVVAAGGPARGSVVATLVQAGGQLLGAAANRVYLEASPEPGARPTAVFAVGLADGAYGRVAGEDGLSSPVVRPDGAVCWVGNSQDSSNIYQISSVRTVGRTTAPDTIADWLPSNGHLYPSGSGLFYIDAGTDPLLWPITSNQRLVSPHLLPNDYTPIAVGEHDVLVRRNDGGGQTHLYTLRLD